MHTRDRASISTGSPLSTEASTAEKRQNPRPLWLHFPGGKIVAEKDNKRPTNEALHWTREGDASWWPIGTPARTP